MRRDMDLIRELLLRLEAMPRSLGTIHALEPGQGELAVENYSDEEVRYQLDLMEEAGLMENKGEITSTGAILFDRLSWAGHDFLDSIRDPDIWAKTKQGASSAGGFTVELLKELAKGFIKKQIKDRTGIDL